MATYNRGTDSKLPPIMQADIRVHTVAYLTPHRLDSVAKKLNAGDTIQLALESIEITSPDIIFEIPIRIEAAAVRLV